MQVPTAVDVTSNVVAATEVVAVGGEPVPLNTYTGESNAGVRVSG